MTETGGTWNNIKCIRYEYKKKKKKKNETKRNEMKQKTYRKTISIYNYQSRVAKEEITQSQAINENVRVCVDGWLAVSILFYRVPASASIYTHDG